MKMVLDFLDDTSRIAIAFASDDLYIFRIDTNSIHISNCIVIPHPYFIHAFGMTYLSAKIMLLLMSTVLKNDILQLLKI